MTHLVVNLNKFRLLLILISTIVCNYILNSHSLIFYQDEIEQVQDLIQKEDAQGALHRPFSREEENHVGPTIQGTTPKVQRQKYAYQEG